MDLTKIDKPFGELDRETKIALFAAWVDGDGLEHYSSSAGEWVYTEVPSWNSRVRYRKAAPTKPSIDWDHVSCEFKWMAKDSDGRTFVYNAPPCLGFRRWDFYGIYVIATAFASFTPGTCDWKDSLVRRPE